MPTYLLYGPNTYASTQKRREIVRRYLEKYGILNSGTLEGETLTIDRYRDSIVTVPLLTATRLAVILNALTLAKPTVKTYIEQTLSAIPTDTIVIFHETKPIDRRWSLFKTLNQPKYAQLFEPWDERVTTDWLIKTATQLGGTLSPQDAHYMIKTVGSDPPLLDQELRKLILFAPTITQASMNLLSPPRSDRSVFTIIDMLRQNNPQAFLRVADELIGQGQPTQYLLSLVATGLRQMAAVLAAPSNVSPWQLARQLRLPPFVIDAIIHHSPWTLHEVKNAYAQLADLDMALKTGTMDESVALDVFVMRAMKNIRHRR